MAKQPHLLVEDGELADVAPIIEGEVLFVAVTDARRTYRSIRLSGRGK